MKYFLCILLPPFAVFKTGKTEVSISIILTLLGWIPGVIHAILITNKYYAEKKHDELIEIAKKKI